MNRVLTSILSVIICALIVVGIVFATGGFKHNKNNGVEDIVPGQSAELEELQAQYDELLQNNNELKSDINYMQNWKPWGQNGPVFNDMQFSIEGQTVCGTECTSDDYVELRFVDTGSAGKLLFPKFSIGGTIIDTYKTNDSGQVTTSVSSYSGGNSTLYFIKPTDWANSMLVHVSSYLKYYKETDYTGAKYYHIDIYGIQFNNTNDNIFTIKTLNFPAPYAVE